MQGYFDSSVFIVGEQTLSAAPLLLASGYTRARKLQHPSKHFYGKLFYHAPANNLMQLLMDVMQAVQNCWNAWQRAHKGGKIHQPFPQNKPTKNTYTANHAGMHTTFHFHCV